MASGIYCIRNMVNGKRYVGSAKDIERRINRHFLLLSGNVHPSHHLQNAYLKYGEEAFGWAALEECPLEQLVEREQYWIDRLKPEYNKRLIASSNIGLKFPDQEKKRASLRIAFADPEYRQKRAELTSVGWADPEIRARRIAGLVQVWTPEKRAAVSEKQKGIDNGAKAREVRWAADGERERWAQVTRERWLAGGGLGDKKLITEERLRIAVEAKGFVLVSYEGLRKVDLATIECPKHGLSVRKVQDLVYKTGGCRGCRYDKTSASQKGKPRPSRPNPTKGMTRAEYWARKGVKDGEAPA